MAASQDAQGRTWSLSLVPVRVIITSDAVGTLVAGTGVTTDSGSSTTPVLVSEVTFTYRTNDLAEASISLGYSSKEGLAKLESLFPREGSPGAYFATVEIWVGSGGPLSYAPFRVGFDKPLFKGYVLGFSHSKSGADISFVVNAVTSVYPLTQIPVTSPGFHPTTGEGLGVITMISNDAFAGRVGDLQVGGALVKNIGQAKNPVDAVKSVLRVILSHWDASSASIAALPPQLQSAFDLWGLKDTKAEVEKALALIKSVGDMSNLALDLSNTAVAEELARSVTQRGGMMFWTYLMGIFDTLGVDLISVGGECFCIPMSPLTAPPAGNRIRAMEEVVVSIKDFPFDSPTRCVVLPPNHSLTSGPAGGVFPNGKAKTSQEEKTGIKTLVLNAPSFLVANAKRIEHFRDAATAKSLEGGKNKSTDVKPSNAEAKVTRDKAVKDEVRIYDSYAQYFLMKQKFRQRTGMCVCRFRPDILPGFCVEIEDPLSAVTLFAYVSEVTHTLSHSSATAQTSMSLSYVRYGGETPEGLDVNPLYSNFDAESAAKTILKDGLGIF